LTRYFCTYFDSNFLYQGLALYRSLCQHAGDFRLWVLALDDTAFGLLNRLELPGLRTIRLEDFEAAHPQLAAVRAERSLLEYYWTATPMLPSYVFNLRPQVDMIAYLDADLFFYDDLEAIYDEWGAGSIYLVPHRFGPKHRYTGELHGGLFNVGFNGFRRDASGLGALERWAGQTVAWCYDRIEPGLQGDQKYLHDWPQRHSGVVVSENHGVGAGGWNIFNYRISQGDGHLYLDDSRLVMLHLNWVDLLSDHFFTAIANWSMWPLYRPYAAALKWGIHRVKQVAPDFEPRYKRIPLVKWLTRSVRGGIVPV